MLRADSGVSLNRHTILLAKGLLTLARFARHG
jgi:hypothetical protein